MAKRISQLDELVSLDGTEDIPIIKGGRNYRIKSSVVGGAVTKASLGLGNVDNTSDAAKPISNATQSALNGKANTVHSHAIGEVTGLTQALSEKANATHGHALGEIAGLQTALDGKADVLHSHDSSSISGLDALLAGKSDTGHTHTKDQISGLDADLTNLQSQLNQKANTVHGHNPSEIADFYEAVSDAVASAMRNVTVDDIQGFDNRVITLIQANGGGTPATVVAGVVEW